METRNRPKRAFARLLALLLGSHHYGSPRAYTRLNRLTPLLDLSGCVKDQIGAVVAQEY